MHVGAAVCFLPALPFQQNSGQPLGRSSALSWNIGVHGLVCGYAVCRVVYPFAFLPGRKRQPGEGEGLVADSTSSFASSWMLAWTSPKLRLGSLLNTSSLLGEGGRMPEFGVYVLCKSWPGRLSCVSESKGVRWSRVTGPGIGKRLFPFHSPLFPGSHIWMFGSEGL